jgi:DNA-binding MarR family transcriptional regulator
VEHRMPEMTIEGMAEPEVSPASSYPSLSAAAAARGLTPRMLAVLACAASTPGLPGKEVARRMRLTAAEVCYANARLGQMGLTKTRPDPADLRRVMIFLTAAGTDMLRRIADSVALPAAVVPFVSRDAHAPVESDLIAA